MYKQLGMAALAGAAAYGASGRGRRNRSGVDVAESILRETYTTPRRGESPQAYTLRHLQAAENYVHEAGALSGYSKQELRDADHELERRIEEMKKRTGRSARGRRAMVSAPEHRPLRASNRHQLVVGGVQYHTRSKMWTVDFVDKKIVVEFYKTKQEAEARARHLEALAYADAPLPLHSRGRRAAPTTKQRKKMGPSKMALPWDQASWTYKKNHPRYRGIGGYPMDTKLRAAGARAYAIASYNAHKLTKRDVEIIFRRTRRRYRSMPKFDGMVCQRPRKNAKRRKCRSSTSG